VLQLLLSIIFPRQVYQSVPIISKFTINNPADIPFKEVKSGSGYLSQNDMRLHFGLGDAKQINSVTGRRLCGHVKTLRKMMRIRCLL